MSVVALSVVGVLSVLAPPSARSEPGPAGLGTTVPGAWAPMRLLPSIDSAAALP